MMHIDSLAELGDCDVEITFRIKEFCSSQSTSDFLLCEMSTVLRGLFFLILNVISTSQSPNSASESHLHQEPQTGLTLHCPGSHDAYRFR